VLEELRLGGNFVFEKETGRGMTIYSTIVPLEFPESVHDSSYLIIRIT
jgi:hypothetical protein